jgi:transglutaminase-like putative cysteine protease
MNIQNRPKSMKHFLPLFSFLFFLSFASSQKVHKKVPSHWINAISYQENKDLGEEGSYRYLLIDFQDNLASQERYAHYAIKILNADGVQEMSDISVGFDPSFQQLTFHSANIIRDGTVVDKLKNTEIKVFQRETNLERSLYDGSLTAVLNLSDVREGDIIEYAYTIKGFNPINKGHFSTVYYQQYTLPVNRIYNRLVNNGNKKITYEKRDGGAEPIILETEFGKEYVWDHDATDRVLYDNNVPFWYSQQKRVAVSTFDDWGSVVELMRPLYETVGSVKAPSEVVKDSKGEDEKITKLIRFVQGEVRYLGFESGIGAYKPNPPSKVLSRRFGDCKDKSLLLVNLLKNEGVDASPLLVNTYSKDEIKEFLPSHNAFDHCIVYFNHKGKDYFVDPTISNQGGGLSNLNFPRYGYGLRIKENESDLIKIPVTARPQINITETIVVDSIGGSAIFLVESEYTGSRADYMRSYFQNSTEESINNEYLNFYSSLYPGIVSTDKIRFTDNSRDGSNVVTIEEYYKIEDFWYTQPNTGATLYCETYPLVLESLINYPKSAKRTMPYHLGSPFFFNQKTTITLPEPWLSKDSEFTLDEDRYELKKETLQSSEVADFLAKHDQINDQTRYQLSYFGNSEAASGISTTAIIIALLAFVLGIYFAIRIYKNYNPQPHESCQGQAIGGWLVLPAIGLVLSPFVMGFQIFSSDYFARANWLGLQNLDIENPGALSAVFGAELFVNILFLIFSLLLAVLFFTKRTSLPKLIIGFYAVNFAFTLIDLFVYDYLVPSYMLEDDPTPYTEATRSFIAAAIWIPYFLVSERVKKTFCNVYPNKVKAPLADR